ncbi:MAG: hypothetical protein H6765_02040 [Candidatus Peribacteria bacterium]|nr:MAG: hypothetical protein H6765_02040 [Candidatus Peribacteria bacterium]
MEVLPPQVEKFRAVLQVPFLYSHTYVGTGSRRRKVDTNKFLYDFYPELKKSKTERENFQRFLNAFSSLLKKPNIGVDGAIYTETRDRYRDIRAYLTKTQMPQLAAASTEQEVESLRTQTTSRCNGINDTGLSRFTCSDHGLCARGVFRDMLKFGVAGVDDETGGGMWYGQNANEQIQHLVRENNAISFPFAYVREKPELLDDYVRYLEKHMYEVLASSGGTFVPLLLDSFK